MIDLAAFVSETAFAVVEAAAKDIIQYGSAVETEAPFLHHYQEEKAFEMMKANMLPSATAYFMDAYAPDGDHSLRFDWDGEFMSEVVYPAIKLLWDTEMVPKYSGFGPRSIVNRFKKDRRTPPFARVMKLAERRFLEGQRS